MLLSTTSHSRSVTSLGGHVALQTCDLEAGELESSSDEVEEAGELGEDQALDGRVFGLELAELFDERFDLGRGSPFARVDLLQHALPRLDEFLVRVLVEIDGDGQMADGALGLPLCCRLEVLPDTVSAEDVLAPAHDRVLSLVQADPTGGDRQVGRRSIAEESLGRLALENEIRVARSLPHTREQLEDVCVVVEQRVCSYVGRELSLDVGVEGRVELLLLFSEVVSSNLDISGPVVVRSKVSNSGSSHFAAREAATTLTAIPYRPLSRLLYASASSSGAAG